MVGRSREQFTGCQLNTPFRESSCISLGIFLNACAVFVALRRTQTYSVLRVLHFDLRAEIRVYGRLFTKPLPEEEDPEKPEGSWRDSINPHSLVVS